MGSSRPAMLQMKLSTTSMSKIIWPYLSKNCLTLFHGLVRASTTLNPSRIERQQVEYGDAQIIAVYEAQKGS